MLTVADRGGGKICQNLADFICERSLSVCELPLLGGLGVGLEKRTTAKIGGIKFGRNCERYL